MNESSNENDVGQQQTHFFRIDNQNTHSMGYCWWLFSRHLLVLFLLAVPWMYVIARSDFGISFAYRWNSGVVARSLVIRSYNNNNNDYPLHQSRLNLESHNSFVSPWRHKILRYYGRVMMTSSDTAKIVNENANNDPLEGLPSPLILGSASFTRKLILKNMGINYHIVVRPIDEKEVGCRESNTPEELVQAVAHAKMNHLVKEIIAGNCVNDLPIRSNDVDDTNPGWIIMTADQVVTCQGRILEKPDDITQAKEFVAQYGKHPCSTVGCVVLTHLPSQITISGIHIATVHFLPTLTEDTASNLVDELIQNNEPILSCAGGLMIEHPLTQQHVDRIEGNMDIVMGLCPETVRRLLRGLNASIR